MPIYEYKCLKCNKKFEEYQDMNDNSVVICKCGGETKKLISLNSSQVETSYNAKEYYENVIRPEARAIAEKIKNGDENTAADIFGEPQE